MKKISKEVAFKLDIALSMLLPITILFTRFVLKSEHYMIPIFVFIGIILLSYFFREKGEKDEKRKVSFAIQYLLISIAYLLFQFLIETSTLWIGIGATIGFGGLLSVIHLSTFNKNIGKVSGFFISMMALVIFIISPYVVEKVELAINRSQVEESANLFQYKDTYIGAGGTVSNIVRQLPNPTAEQPKHIELKTDKEPYGLIIPYIESDIINETTKEEILLTNATYLFTLIKNVDWITFQFTEGEQTVTREQLEIIYNKDLRDFQSEAELKAALKPFLQDKEKLKELIK